MSSRWGAPHQPPVSSNDARDGGGDRDSRRSERGYQQDGMRARAVYQQLSSDVILNLSDCDIR